MHETPDIEVAADQWEEEQAVLAEVAQGEFAGVNSCDALRIIDSVPYQLYHPRLNQLYVKMVMTRGEADEMNQELADNGCESRWERITLEGE